MALILAIEDHDEVLTLLSIVLKDKHQVLLAPDSTSGLRMAKDLRPDLILLDVGMPDVDGLEVCRALRRDPDTHHMPVLLVTARLDIAENPVQWRAAGADGAVAKPFSPSHLLASIDDLLASGRPPS
jgi:DNA-binding response OmpR family regulator